MDIKVIERLIKLTNKSDLTELTIEEKDFSITLKKEKEVQVVTRAQVEPTIIQHNPQPNIQAPVIAEKQAGEVEGQKPDYIKVITAPMVGTYYSAPGPNEPEFAKVGDSIKKGQVVCILEAMKLMNDIESDVEGKVVNILVGNEDMVEYGQPIMEIDTRA